MSAATLRAIKVGGSRKGRGLANDFIFSFMVLSARWQRDSSREAAGWGGRHRGEMYGLKRSMTRCVGLMQKQVKHGRLF